MQDATRQTRSMPYLDAQGDLVIPFDTPPKYQHWRAGGQSILQTLAELNAPPEVVRRHVRESDQVTKERQLMTDEQKEPPPAPPKREEKLPPPKDSPDAIKLPGIPQPPIIPDEEGSQEEKKN